jgi:phage baseplate assembly protein V
MFNIAEIERRLANLVRIGVIDQVDEAARRIRVRSGATLTAWLPWPADVGKNYNRWRPLRAGTQVILVSPSGDLAQAVIAGMMYTAALDAPVDDPNLDVIAFDDGTVLRYDSGTSKLQIECVGDVQVQCVNAEVTASAGVTVDAQTVDVTAQAVTVTASTLDITAATSHDGNINVTGTITVSGGDVIADGKSLKTHVHGGVTAGAAVTGVPV